jgi:6-phosphofructokinase 1
VRLYNKPGGKGRQGTIVIRSEGASKTYTTEVIRAIYEHEAGGVYDAKSAVLGHAQQGGVPSPLDRTRATRLAAHCVEWMVEQCNAPQEKPGYRVYTKKPSTAVVIGIVGAKVEFSAVEELRESTDFNNRRSKDQWWRGFEPLIKILAKYGVDTDEEEPIFYDLDEAVLTKWSMSPKQEKGQE